MMKPELILTLSGQLCLESIDPISGERVIFNALTGQRLKMTEESMKILATFRKPMSLGRAAKRLGIRGRQVGKQFRSLIDSLMKATFLLDASHSAMHEQQNLRTIIETDCFVRPKISFASSPSITTANLGEGSVVFAGIPIDQATTGYPGARHGPEKLREVSTRFISYDRDIFTLANRGWYNAHTGRTILESVPCADVGNVVNNLSEDLAGFYKRCRRAAQSIYERRSLPVFIGGDHSISAPLIGACQEAHSNIMLIHLDAHTDLAEWDPSVTHHHGNVMTRVLHESSCLEIHQFGIRGFAGIPAQNGRCHVTRQIEIDTDIDLILESRIPKGRQCYISLDVDVLDPGFAPGTGTPVPMGMNPTTLLRILEAVTMHNEIVGIDVVELCPSLDRGDMTASLLFHILMCLLGWARKK